VIQFIAGGHSITSKRFLTTPVSKLEKTKKLNFAYRMHKDDTINDASLNIYNREAEITKPLIRQFGNSPSINHICCLFEAKPWMDRNFAHYSIEHHCIKYPLLEYVEGLLKLPSIHSQDFDSW